MRISQAGMTKAGATVRDRNIYIAGHEGMIGSAVIKRLEKAGYENLTGRSSEELDLRDQQAVREVISGEKPDAVVITAKVLGGILSNDQHPYTIFHDNMIIQSNLVDAALHAGVKKLILMGNSTIYPKDSPQPVKEEAITKGPLEVADDWYSMAKLTGVKLCEAVRRQYKCNYISLIPSNIYGPHDRFEKAYHYISDMIRNFHQARERGHEPVSIWGSGKCRREFLFVDDLADAVFFFLEHETENAVYNVGTGKDLPIEEVASVIRQIVGHKGEVRWEVVQREEIPRKWMDVSRLSNEGWTYKTELREGLQKTYEWYLTLPEEKREEVF